MITCAVGHLQNTTLITLKEFFRGENREQERQERNCRGYGQTGNVLELEWNDAHHAHNGIAVTEICQRLKIDSSEQVFVRRDILDDPFPIESLDAALRKQAVVGQTLSFCASHPRSKH